MTDEEVAKTLREISDDYWDDDGYGNMTCRFTEGIIAIDKAIDAVEERGRVLHWMSKFCRHIDMGDRPYTDAEAYEFFKNKMKQQFGWEVEE